MGLAAVYRNGRFELSYARECTRRDARKAEERVEKILPDSDELTLAIKEETPDDNFIIMRALEFPWINILWLGIVVMAAGFTISMINRIYENRRKKGKHAAT